MPNTILGGKAVCPFFSKHEGDKIYCNNYNNCKVRVTFDTRETINEQMTPICISYGYVECPLYKFLYERLESK